MAEVTATVNGLRYREMINDFLWPGLDGMDLDNLYFQQESATRHTSNETIDLLKAIAIGHWSYKRSRGGDLADIVLDN